jgi:phosphatidylserine synthase
LGLFLKAQALPWVALLAIAAWTTDSLDGPIARRSRVTANTWIGDHDLLVDVVVATSVLIYMLAAGFVSLYLGLAFSVLWALLFSRYGLTLSFGALFQVLIYVCFITLSFREAPAAGFLILAWLLVAVVVKWPRFRRELVPAFLAGFRESRRP